MNSKKEFRIYFSVKGKNNVIGEIYHVDVHINTQSLKKINNFNQYVEEKINEYFKTDKLVVEDIKIIC